jgi:hypothetical protein
MGCELTGRVTSAFHVLTGSEVALKSGTALEDTPDMPCVVRYEALVYSLLRGHPGIPSCKWSGLDRGSYVLILEQLGANLEELRRLSRGKLPWKTVVMLGVQMVRVSNVRADLILIFVSSTESNLPIREESSCETSSLKISQWASGKSLASFIYSTLV